MANFLQNGFIKSAVLAVTVVALALFFMPEVESRSVRRKNAVDAAPKGSGCKLFYYFDGGTELCEHCRDICDHAVIKGTEVQCQRECEEYLKAQHCRSDEYYDDQTRACSPCRDICQHHKIRGTTGACQTYCPGYQPATQTPSPTTSRPPALEDVEGKKDPRLTHNPPASALTHHLVWILPSVSLLIFLAAVGVALLVFNRRKSHPVIVKYQPASVTEESLTSCPPVIAPLTRPQTETQPGINSELVCS